MEARADPAQDQWLFKGPWKMALYSLRSAQPIPLVWAPLFKFTPSATTLGHKLAKGTVGSVLGPLSNPTIMDPLNSFHNLYNAAASLLILSAQEGTWRPHEIVQPFRTYTYLCSTPIGSLLPLPKFIKF